MLGWLSANPEQASDVMEATVRLLSGKSDGNTSGIRALDSERLTRSWASMTGCGCEGRFTPVASAQGGAAQV